MPRQGVLSTKQKALAWIAIIPLTFPPVLATPQLKSIELRHPIIGKIRFAWLLPVAQLLLCAAILWPIRLTIVHELHIPLPPVIEQTMVADCQRWSPKQDFFLSSVVALNIPGGLIQLPYAMNTPTKREWSPKGMNDLLWRAVTWPFLCIPFWWIAGRAIDGLTVVKHQLVRPRISSLETAIGSIWMALCALLFVGSLVMAGIKKDHALTRIAAGCGLWALLGALSLIARFRQKRLPILQSAAATATSA
jgi:hypothetical protein